MKESLDPGICILVTNSLFSCRTSSGSPNTLVASIHEPRVAPGRRADLAVYPSGQDGSTHWAERTVDLRLALSRP